MRRPSSYSLLKVTTLTMLLTVWLAIPASSTVIQHLEFAQDGVLPSAQSGIVFFNTMSTESALYSVWGGQLHQLTFGTDPGNASYLSPNVSETGGPFDASLAVSMVARVKIVRIGTGPAGGAYFQMFDGANGLALLFRPDGLEVPVASGTNAFIPRDDIIGSFHTYRLMSPGGSPEVRLYIDGVLVFTGTATASGLNGFDFGDGISAAGSDADADWDFVEVSQDGQSFTAEWNAGDGLTPEVDCPWTLVNQALPATPSLSAGVLTLATAADQHQQTMYYEQDNEQLEIPSVWVIEARLRVVAESHPAGEQVRGVAIGFASAPGAFNVLEIGRDEFFLWTGWWTAGPAITFDTDDAFHTYRIEVSENSAVQVYYDGTLKISGAMVTGPNVPALPDLWWGDGTGWASSVSDWTSFKHNGSARGCTLPSPLLLAPAPGATVDGSVDFSWAPVSGASAYMVTVASLSNLSSPIWTAMVSGGTQAHWDPGPEFPAGQMHFWSVRAQFSQGWGPYATARTLTRTTPSLALSAPVLLGPAIGDEVALPDAFSWTAVTGASGFEIQASSSILFESLEWHTQSTQSVVRPPVAAGPTPGQTYYWRVRAFCPSVVSLTLLYND